MAENTRGQDPNKGENIPTGRTVKDIVHNKSEEKNIGSSLEEKSSGQGRKEKSTGLATKDGLTGSDRDGQVTE